jgi:hypothetical protein
MRGAAEVMDAVLLELRFKPRLPAPVGVLPAIVRQHLLGQAIFAHRPPIHFQHVLGGLTAIKPQPDQVAGVIVHEPNQIGILAADANRANVALPHLIGRSPLEEPRLGRILDRLTPTRLDQLLLVQHAPHRLATDRQQQPPAQPLADLLHAHARLLLPQGGDVLAHRRGQPRAIRPNHLRWVSQPGFAFAAITPHPLRQCAGADAHLADDQSRRETFFQLQLDRFQAELKRIGGPTAAPRKPPRGLGGWLLLF